MSGLDFDGLLLDLDGCVYTGRTAVPGAARLRPEDLFLLTDG